jgi:F-type H+-transporting ATPase subunit a
VAAEGGKIDPMHQFTVEPLVPLNVGGYDLSFTNSALFMVVVLGLIWVFMLGGMKRQLVPGRWQVAVESVTGFITNMLEQNVGPQGRKFVPYVFFSLFVPHGTPLVMVPLLFVIELFSFLIRPFSLALRLFVAMTAGHILMKVLAGFVINGLNAEALWVAPVVALPSFILMIGITLLELLVCAIQAYVFALLTSLYINDAVNLH